MKTYYILPIFITFWGLQAQVASSAVSQGDLNFLAGTIYIEMNIPSGRMARPDTMDERFRLSPNPVTDYLYFVTDEKISKACIYDMGGKKVLECAIVDNKADLRELQRGSYIIVTEGTLSQGHIFLKK